MNRRFPIHSPVHSSDSIPGRWLRWIVAAVLGTSAALGQGSRADYERAGNLAERTENRVFRQRVKPVWTPDSTSLWYRVATGPGMQEFVRVDAVTGERRPLFDHARLSAALSPLLGTHVAADRLPLEQVSWVPGASPQGLLQFRTGNRRWVWDPASGDPTPATQADSELPSLAGVKAPTRSAVSSEDTQIVFRNETLEDLDLFWLDPEGQRQGYGRVRAGQERAQHTYVGHVFLLTDREGTTVAVFEAQSDSPRAVIRPGNRREEPAATPATPAREPGTSPDGRWRIVLKDHNLRVRDLAAGEEWPLSADGTPEEPYREEIAWAPDSASAVGTRVRPGGNRQVTVLEAAPKDQTQPKIHSHRYLKPGDPLPKPRLRLFTMADRRQVDVDDASYPNPFTEDGDLDLRWAPDGRTCYFNYNQRGHQRYRILAIHVAAGRAGVTNLVPRVVVEETATTFIDWTNKTWRHWLDATGEVLWMSERDGWAHLWLHDAASGRVTQQVTRGTWVVREVLHVDEARREVWFMASGVRPEQDPYHLHLCRVGLDGTGFRILTVGDSTHRIEFSPDRRWFLDTGSRVDLPPVTELRRSGDGELVCVLEQGDASALTAAGWTMPERFSAPGRDGATPIHGILILPSNFDPSRRYPVVEEIYAGPHGAFVPKEFGRLLRQHALAELGFVVVQVDGMGTNHRGKRFHDVAWKNLADSGLPDHIAWLRAAAATRPWMDLSRVGIYGGSAGGQSSTRALLDYPEVYTVGVSDCGCHDNRMDKIWWNEQWLGWPVDDSYRKSSNVEHAARLKGRLLLIVGELDTNVDPASTLQLAAALVRADRDFDLLVMPGSNHGAAESPYGIRRRQDFFVRHLLGREPRWE